MCAAPETGYGQERTWTYKIEDGKQNRKEKCCFFSFVFPFVSEEFYFLSNSARCVQLFVSLEKGKKLPDPGHKS